jgi:hypothetical protein
VKPVNTALHQSIVFYVKVTADGGSTAFFGPYTLTVGCTTTSVVYTDSPSFVTDAPHFVEGTTVAAYTLIEPLSSRVWCTI